MPLLSLLKGGFLPIDAYHKRTWHLRPPRFSIRNKKREERVREDASDWVSSATITQLMRAASLAKGHGERRQ